MPNPSGAPIRTVPVSRAHRAADRLLVGDDGRFHRLRAVGDALAGLGEEVAGLAAVKQFCGEVSSPAGRHGGSLWHDRRQAVWPQPKPIRRARWPARSGSRPSRSCYRLDPAFSHIYGALSRTCIPEMQVDRICQTDHRDLRESFHASIGHFIGGKEVKGTSGRTADVFEPMTGDVQAKVALASKAEVRAAVENARAAQPRMGHHQPAAPGARDDEVPRTGAARLRQARRAVSRASTARPCRTPRATSSAASKWWNSPGIAFLVVHQLPRVGRDCRSGRPRRAGAGRDRGASPRDHAPTPPRRAGHLTAGAP